MVAGLGNPEPCYARTPHNLGFLTLAELRRRWGVTPRVDGKFRAETADCRRGGRRVWLLAPLTYMNLSGEAVRPFCGYHDIPPKNTLVVCDDHDLRWGRFRLRASGSSGGHKGLMSIQRLIGTDEYPRLRIGIRPENPRDDLVEYVLTPFHGEGLELAELVVARAADAVEMAIDAGLAEAMNQFNGLDLAAGGDS